MGRFVIQIRYKKTEWGMIYFRNRESILVWQEHPHYLTAFTRYWAERGSYPDWHSFRELCKKPNVTVPQLFRSALKHGIVHETKLLQDPPSWVIADQLVDLTNEKGDDK